MAREEHDRENLLAEATSYVARISLTVPGFAEEIFIGFGRERRTSFYFGPDRAYHANSVGQLRRAFIGGLLYKARHGRLVAMERRHTGAAVELVSRDLTDEEQRQFVEALQRELAALRDAIATGAYSISGQVPEGADVLGRVIAWLNEFYGQVAVADSPRAR
jgi:hypothetical protein